MADNSDLLAQAQDIQKQKLLSQAQAIQTAKTTQPSGIGPTIVDKLAQGATAGFSDELSGAGEAAGRMMGIEGLGGKIKDMRAAPGGPTFNMDDLKKAYQAGRDKDRAVQKQESADHPIISTAAEIAGGVASPINKLAKGASLAKQSAIFGGVAGLGNSEADNVPDAAKDTALGTLLGYGFGKAGEAVGKIPGLVKQGVKSAGKAIADKVGPGLEYTPIADKEAVLSAADQLGIKSVPKAVLTDNPTYQKLESGLAQSGSLPAKSIREQYTQLGKGLEKASDKIEALKTPDSDFSIGKSIQKDLSSQIEDSRKPVTELYNNITPDLQKIPVNEGVVNKAIGQLKKQPLFQTKDGAEFLAEHKDLILNQPELNSLKEYRSSLSDLTNQNSLPADVKRAEALRNAVTKIRDNSIEAMKAEMPASAHPEINDLIDKVSLADAAHAGNLKDLNAVKSIVGNKDISSPSKFLNKLSDAKESDLAQRAGNLDVSSLQSLKEKFPTVFEKAKTAKVNDMIQSATNAKSGFNDNAFMKQYNNLDKELKDLLFEPEMQKHIEALQILKRAIPDKLGPSGTPEGTMTMDMFSPRRNVLDLGIKKTLDAASSSPASQAASQPGKVISMVKQAAKSPLTLIGSNPDSAAKALPNAADNKPTKGPDKWANDGAKNIIEHDSSTFSDPSVIEQIMNTKKGKDLLIRASDLKPGTKAMDNLVEKIKSANLKEGAE